LTLREGVKVSNCIQEITVLIEYITDWPLVSDLLIRKTLQMSDITQQSTYADERQYMLVIHHFTWHIPNICQANTKYVPGIYLC